jgi:protein TonB
VQQQPLSPAVRTAGDARDDRIQAGLPLASAGAPGVEGAGNPGGSGSGAGGDGLAGGLTSGPHGELPATIADIDPVPLQSISAPYPSAAKRLGQQGLVKVRADIDAQGIVIGEQISVSSGFASLDNAALDAVEKTRFLPAMKNGKSVAASIIVPIRFELTQE